MRAWECMTSYEDVCFFHIFMCFKVVSRPGANANGGA